MIWFVLAIWVLGILMTGALMMWAARKEASSAFLSSLIPSSPAWEKRMKKREEKRMGKARIVGSFKIPPSAPSSSLPPKGRKVLATSSSVIEVQSLKASALPLPGPPLPKGV